MPELPEAEVICRELRSALLGAQVTRFWIGREDIIREGLSARGWFEGATIANVQRYGKTVVVTCEKDRESRYMVAELGMTGLLLFRDVPRKFDTHIHVIVDLQGGKTAQLRYWNARRFGRMFLLDGLELSQFLHRRFGADPLTMAEGEFMAMVTHSRGRLKPLLMNQRKIAGIGNIYANEILHRAGIHPLARGKQLRKASIRRLYGTMQEVLREAIMWGGSTIRDFCAPDGTPGRFQERHRVYQKAGCPCPRGCPGTIGRLPGERSSFLCPRCQKRR